MRVIASFALWDETLLQPPNVLITTQQEVTCQTLFDMFEHSKLFVDRICAAWVVSTDLRTASD